MKNISLEEMERIVKDRPSVMFKECDRLLQDNSQREDAGRLVAIARDAKSRILDNIINTLDKDDPDKTVRACHKLAYVFAIDLNFDDDLVQEGFGQIEYYFWDHTLNQKDIFIKKISQKKRGCRL